MEIVNGTCYLTEDIEALWDKINETILTKEKTKVNWARGLTKPDKLLIGYFNTTLDPKRVKSVWESSLRYASSSGEYSESPRLGIAPRRKLPLQGLSALAEADAEYSTVPTVALRSIVRAMINLGRGSTTTFKEDDEDQPGDPRYWDWLKTFNLRFRDKATKTEKESAKTATELRRKAAFARLPARRRSCQNGIDNNEAKARGLRNRLAEVESYLVKARERLAKIDAKIAKG